MSNQTLAVIISLLALILSASMWVYTLVTHRKNVSIKIEWYIHHDSCPQFYVLFENRSRLPISFTRVALKAPGGEIIDCVPVPERIFTRTRCVNGEIVDRRSFYSLPMPISVDSLGAVGGFVYFVSDQQLFQNPPKIVTFLICTNRGKIGELQCRCPDPAH